jgi:hypothetical protein
MLMAMSRFRVLALRELRRLWGTVKNGGWVGVSAVLIPVVFQEKMESTTGKIRQSGIYK